MKPFEHTDDRVVRQNMPPLANFVAVHDEMPSALDATERALRGGGQFEEVFRPHAAWVVGVAGMPDSDPDPPGARAAGLVFAEGRRELERGFEIRLRERYQQVAEQAGGKPDSLQSLPGDFTFIHFSATGRGTAVRSVAGSAPVYVWQRPGRIAVATRLRSLIALSGCPVEADDLICGIWGLGFGLFPDGRTFLKNVRLLGRGTYAVLEDGRARYASYWKPPMAGGKPPKESVQVERAQEFRRLLVGYMDDHLHPAAANLLSLSGGVDSGSLLAVAAGTLKREMATWTVLAPPGASRNLELSYICPLLERFRIRHAWLTAYHDGRLVRYCQNGANLQFPIFDPTLIDLSKLQAAWGVKTICTGLFADELCGSAKTVPDLFLAVPFSYVLRQMLGRHAPWKDSFRWIKHRALWLAGKPLLPLPSHMPPVLDARLQEEYSDWFEICRRRLRERTPMHYYMLATLDWLEGHMVSTWEAGSSLGIRGVHPFQNRQVLDFACATHPSEKIRPDNKKLLRRALADVVPERTLFRPDKGIVCDLFHNNPLPEGTLIDGGLGERILQGSYAWTREDHEWGFHLAPLRLAQIARALNSVDT